MICVCLKCPNKPELGRDELEDHLILVHNIKSTQITEEMIGEYFKERNNNEVNEPAKTVKTE